MKTIKFFVCILLALFVIVTVTACDSLPSESVPEPSEVSADDSQPVESQEESSPLFANLPADKTFDGETVTFLVVGDYADLYKSVEIMPQESSYDLLKLNVQSRNDLVSERFGVDIAEVRTSNEAEMVAKIRESSMAGVCEYDIVMPYMYDAATLAMEGYFYDLNTLEHVHLDQPYYDRNSISGLSIRNKNYFVSGDLCLLDFACTHALVFNKDMVVEHGLESPYELVENHEWTLDKMQEMAHGVASDSDGTAGMGYQDTYGFLINQNFSTSMFVGCGFRLTTKNQADEPIVALDGERSAAAFEKIFNLANDSSSVGRIDDRGGSYYISSSAAGKTCWTAATESVANKKALFRALAIIDVYELGDYECSFGILPTPLYDRSQEEYLCRVSTLCSSCVAIPVNVQNVEKSSIILDAMMQASTETTKKAYFETILKERKIQDLESEHMLDIIFDGRVYDLAYLYNWGSSGLLLSDFMNEIAFSSSNTFVSTWESIRSATQTAIDQTVAAYVALESK